MTEIRTAVKNDVGAVVELWRQLIDYHANLDAALQPAPDAESVFRKFLKKCLKRKDVLVLVAEENGRPVGLCTTFVENNPPVFRAGRFGRISDLVVHKAYRRRGIATLLVEGVKQWLSDNGIDCCRAMVANSNPVANSFWKKAGFKEHIAIMEHHSSKTSPDRDGLR